MKYSKSPPVGDEAPGPVVGADVEGLALRGGVGVVAALHEAVTGEAGVGDGGEDGVILARDPGDVHLEAAVTPGVITRPGPGVVTELGRSQGHTRPEN